MITKTLVHLRIDKVTRMGTDSADADQLLGYFDVPQVPDVGELVNVDGEPYYVVERGWALTSGDPVTFCFIRVK